MPKKQTKDRFTLIERSLDERVSDIMGMPATMRVASKPIWVPTMLEWLPIPILLERYEDDKEEEVWKITCDNIECEGWTQQVAIARMIIMLHNREMKELGAEPDDE